MPIKIMLLWLGLVAFSIKAQAGEFLVFPHPSQAGDAAFLEQPFAAPLRADPRSDRCNILFQGTIESGDLEKLRRVLGYTDASGTYHDPVSGYWQPTLCLDSPGGNIKEALEMAHLLWDTAGTTTRIPSDARCESACAYLYLSGNIYEEGENQDQYFHRVIEIGGRLGLHAPDLNLSPDRSYTSQQVSGAFKLALEAARKVYAYGFQTDSNGEPFMGSYLFARFIETPPDQMYHVDTVGDALLSGLPVTGYRVTGTPNDAWVKTICDNAFMLDDGVFDWVVGPSWKSDGLLSSKSVAAEFSTWSIGDVSWDSYTQGEYALGPQTLSGDRQGADFYGMALSYPTGYPWTLSGCVLRTMVPDGSDLFKVTEITQATSDTYFHVEVMTFNHAPVGQPLPATTPRADLSLMEHAGALSAREAWHKAAQAYEQDEGSFVQYRKYPWLITFPFDHALATLPPAHSAEDAAFTLDTDLGCDALWYKRNLIFHENGYCFGGARGKSAFGNDGCYADAQTIDLTDDERATVSALKKLEKDKGC